MKILNRLADRYSKLQPLPEGVYHTQAMLADEKPYRIHLRLRSDGTGLLILNASTILHLNPTAAEYAYHFIKGTEPDQAAKEISTRYRVSKGLALEDYTDFSDKVKTLLSTPDLDPVSFLDLERVPPHSTELEAPLRLDCALTYKLPEGSKSEHAPVKRVARELSTDEWKTVIDKAWQAGIPHIVFTGGEPTLRSDLPALIAHCEKNGQVCGLLTEGLKLDDHGYLLELLQTGLDHILFILQPEVELSWKVLGKTLAEDIFTAVHLTINSKSVQHAEKTLGRLAELGVKNLSLSLMDDSLTTEFDTVRNKAASLGMRLIFDIPVPYSSSNPVTMETKEDSINSGAGRTWLYLEPDGDVLPAQGQSDKILGNIMTDPWEKIYKP
jgi:organic radical activating enzyme